MPYSMSLYNVGVVTLFISAIINVTNLPVWYYSAADYCSNKYIYLKVKANIIITNIKKYVIFYIAFCSRDLFSFQFCLLIIL